MAAIKEYSNKFVTVKYYPKDNSIRIELKTGGTKQDFFKIENKIKTSLSVASANRDSQISKLIKLSNSPTNSEATVHEFLQSILAGGEATEDASSAAEEAEAPQAPPPSQVQVTPEGMAFKAFKTLLESTYRTGQYWADIGAATGKSKQLITPEDIISSRKVFSSKKKSPERDKVLRALDRAMKYFARKLRLTMGPDAARVYKKRYRSSSDLTPSDYADEQEKEFNIDDPAAAFAPPTEPPPDVLEDPEVALAQKKIEKLFK